MIIPRVEASEIRFIGRSAKELRWRVTDPRVTVGRGTYGNPKFILYSAEDRVEIGNYPAELEGYYAVDPAHDAMEYEPLPRESQAGRIVRRVTSPLLYDGLRRVRNAARTRVRAPNSAVEP